MSRSHRPENTASERPDEKPAEEPSLRFFDYVEVVAQAPGKRLAPGKGPAQAGENQPSVSERCVGLIKHFEGLALKAYRDLGGREAVGYGHHSKPGEDFSLGISESEAHRLLMRDLTAVQKHIRDLVRVPLTQGQYDALVSFTFNLGRGNLARSTLLEKLNAGDYSGAAREFDKWVYGGHGEKKVLPGLVRRRKAERELFEADIKKERTV